MNGIIMNNLIHLKKNKWYFITLFFACVFVVPILAPIKSSFIFVMNMIVFNGMIIIIRYSESWDRYFLTMPISRDDITISKYISGFIMNLYGLIMIAGNILFINALSGKQLETSDIKLIFSTVIYLFLAQGITFPLFIKYGFRKNDSVYFGWAIYILPFIASNRRLLGFDKVLKYMVKLTNPISIILIVIMMVISINLSKKIMAKNEF
ncbi:MAG: ABC-2 transporter permease [Tissierellia bacterium]|nr:ABC-2 transporter permease [Tissierellia bacterium]